MKKNIIVACICILTLVVGCDNTIAHTTPALVPTLEITAELTATPTPEPTATLTPEPTATPTPEPVAVPIAELEAEKVAMIDSIVAEVEHPKNPHFIVTYTGTFTNKSDSTAEPFSEEIELIAYNNINYNRETTNLSGTISISEYYQITDGSNYTTYENNGDGWGKSFIYLDTPELDFFYDAITTTLTEKDNEYVVEYVPLEEGIKKMMGIVDNSINWDITSSKGCIIYKNNAVDKSENKATVVGEDDSYIYDVEFTIIYMPASPISIPDSVLEAMDESNSATPDSNANTSEVPTSTATPAENTSDDATCIQHTDINKDGLCDSCSSDVLAVIDFYCINDLQGKITNSSTTGVDEMTTFFEQTRNTVDNFVLISSGDMWQGESQSNQTRGRIVTDWMNYINFDCMTIGNHEFDWGSSAILENLELANFPFLGINIYDKATNERIPYYSPSVVIEREGVKIGIIGAIGNLENDIAADKIQNLYFVYGDQLTELIKNESIRLREEGCKIIILSYHKGVFNGSSDYSDYEKGELEHYDISLSNGYVNLVFEGHTHREYKYKDANGVWHIQAGGDNGTGFSKVIMNYNKANDELEVSDVEIVDHSSTRSYAPSPIIDELLLKYADELGNLDEVIYSSNRVYEDDELRGIVAKAEYALGIKNWGDKYKIVFGGGNVAIRAPYFLKGDITYAAIQTVSPFDNYFMLCEVTGNTLNEYFFNQPNYSYKLYYEEYGESVRSNLDFDAKYYIVTDNYTYGKLPNSSKIIEVYDENYFIRDTIADYFRTLE